LIIWKRSFFVGNLEIDNSSNEHSLSNSPSRLSENETCRTIVSLLINQCKTNLDLEQQLKYLQSSIKPISIDEHQTHSFSKKKFLKRINCFIFFL
jgi:hypothetical protein